MRHLLVVAAVLIAAAAVPSVAQEADTLEAAAQEADTLAAAAQKADTLEAAAPEGGLTVETIAICTGVENMMPVGESTQFLESAEMLYCYTRINGAADTLEVTHVWFLGDEEKARVPLTIKSASWRTWSSKKMLDAWSGTWRVDILGPDGEVLLSREFVYKPVDE